MEKPFTKKPIDLLNTYFGLILVVGGLLVLTIGVIMKKASVKIATRSNPINI